MIPTIGVDGGRRCCRAGVSTGPGSPAAELSQAPLLPPTTEGRPHLFPDGRLDQDLQQVDLRERNSWRLTLAEVSSVELLETQLVNAVAPFVLNARLKPLMLRTPARQAHRQRVGGRGAVLPAVQDHPHPHTNMAKAALNMMTRTSAPTTTPTAST
jgi:NAD(P)-dependent dehydrogenase (short-subunit alcohol dehydrogenase family)